PQPERFLPGHAADVGVELGLGGMLERIGRGGDEVRQHLAPVDAAPAERVVRHAVELIPADLRSHKARYAGQAHDLRQRRAVAKHIWQPDDVVDLAELLGKEARALRELAHQRLAAGDIAVRLQPHHPDRLEAPFGDALFHALVERRVVLLEVAVDLRLAHAEVVVWVALHQVQRVRYRVRNLLARAPERPEPGDIQVGVAGGDDRWNIRRLKRWHVRAVGGAGFGTF